MAAFGRLVERFQDAVFRTACALVAEVRILPATMPSVALTPQRQRSPVPDEVNKAVQALRARFDPDRLEEAEGKLRELLSHAPPPTVGTGKQMYLLEALDRIERQAASH